MPYFAGPVADERDALLTFLEVRRAAPAPCAWADWSSTRPARNAGGLSAVNPEQSARWVLFHLIQETARHAGHADIIREALDGRRAGQLLDAYEAG